MPAHTPTHNDLPTDEDKLGRGELVRNVAREIATGHPPLVFGIDGDWGSGKTSFLCQLEYELTGKSFSFPQANRKRACNDINHVFTVWFEAWRYQYEPSPIVALLQEICRQLPRHEKILKHIQKWGSLMTKGFFSAVDELSLKIEAAPLSTGVKADVKLKNPVHVITEAAASWDEEHFARRLTTDHVRKQLSEAIEKLLGNEDRRVCVIIDDLDRCESSAAFRLLEGIKIHFSLPQCVFVLGVNLHQIEQAIAPLLPGADEKADSNEKHAEAAEYLEKLCTFTWKLPFLNAPVRSRLLKLWLADPPHAEAKATTPLPEALREAIAKIALDFECLPANPRKIKGLANTIRQLGAHGWTDGARPGTELAIATTEAEALLISATIYHFHSGLLRYLQTSRNAWNELLNWLNNKSKLPDSSDLLKLLKTLRRLSVPNPNAVEAGISPTPGGEPTASLFADPIHLNVFRIQELLRDATNPTKAQNLVTYASIRRYLDLPA